MSALTEGEIGGSSVGFLSEHTVGDLLERAAKAGITTLDRGYMQSSTEAI